MWWIRRAKPVTSSTGIPVTAAVLKRQTSTVTYDPPKKK